MGGISRLSPVSRGEQAMCSVLFATSSWLDSHQYLALWLEGIALLAIFVWDRWDSHQQHKQTLAQMAIMQNQARATETAANAATKSAEALDRQTERTSKPVIVLRRTNWKLSENELLQPQLNVEALVPFELRNVGNGTALVVHWRFKTDSGEDLIHGMMPHLQVGGMLRTRLTAERLGLKQGVTRIFECDYQSVRGETYRSIVKIENLKLVKFETKKI